MNNKFKLASASALFLIAANSYADIVHLDDVIINQSLCIGNDCVNGESFGFDTLRLKENNLRIKAQDTSNSASFPTRDWQLTFNDSSNGGANKFSVDDIDAARTPFTIEGGAPSHSLYVDDAGRIGVGTSTPVVQVHVKDGNTPTLRLEQDGSSGFTPQTWDVAGNEANFFVRDATNGSTLPFRIFPGAPSDALNIEASGDVGVGTTSPTAPLHILRTGSNAQLLMERSGAGIATITGANSGVNIGAQSDHELRFVAGNGAGAGGDKKMAIDSTGSITMFNGGATTGGTYDATTGTWVSGSSRSYKENIADLTAKAALAAFSKLKPVTFNFKKSDEGKVGFIAEDVPELVAENSRKGLSALDFIAVLTKVVQEQQKTISDLEERLEKVEK